MAPVPKKQRPQRQPLTTSLRKICRDYPAGAGILNELLQNADDAGASTVRFVLDTRSYPEKPVLVDGLIDFQGPALLAYNDAKFLEQDFQSLTSIGDSRKAQDKMATGKFGLGFSSVFNWTDNPSIISGSTLLCLDPHHSWSRDFNPPGGPSYDFPADAADECMINQLRSFSLINEDWNHPFEGTIIRIPLRTPSQAERSEISKKTTTKDDVLSAMDSFAANMGSEGLLFLKSVQKIVLEADHERRDEVNIVNSKDLIESETQFKSILKNLMNNKDRQDHENYYEIHLRHWTPQSESVNLYGVLNLTTASVNDEELEVWAASEKLFPWVAVAALLKPDRGNKGGRLFSMLPLPISTGLPLNINGLFSISDDRSRLHGSEKNGVQDRRPERWNRFLFEKMIPSAWAKLLSNVARHHPSENHFRIWPTNTSSTQELWHEICQAVLVQISQNKLPVWFTEIGYVSLQGGLLASDQTSMERKRMFTEGKLAIILVPEGIFAKACLLMEDRILRPGTLFKHLQQTKSIGKMSGQSRLVLLEFLVTEMPLSAIAALEMFPFQDGNFRSVDTAAVFLDRDQFEKELFVRQPERTIDISQLTETTARIFHSQLNQGNCKIRHRTTEDFRDYCLHSIANELKDTTDVGGPAILNDIWTWIFKYGGNKLNLNTIGSLTLVPLQGGGLRQLVPVHDSDYVTWFSPGQMKDLSLKIIALDPRHSPNMLAGHVFGIEILRIFLSLTDRAPSLCVRDGQQFLHYLGFLAQGRTVLRTATDDITDSVLSILRQLYLAQNPKIPPSAHQEFKGLRLFTAVQWSTGVPGISAHRQKVDLMGDSEFLGLRKLVPIPSGDKRIFLDATEEGIRQLFERVGLLKCLDEREILERLVIPALQTGGYDGLTPELRLDAFNVLLSNYHQLTPSARLCLSSLPIVPIQKKKEEDKLSFGLPLNMLDFNKPDLARLYFDNEIQYPDKIFYDRFRDTLAGCGMIQSLNERVIRDRIHVFQRGEHAADKVPTLARNLLQMQFQYGAPYPEDLTRIIREQKWLPAKTVDGIETFSKTAECRDIRDKLIVGHIWPVLPFRVNDSWISILGWRYSVTIDTLMAQMVRAIAASDIESIEATLLYLHQKYSIDQYATRLLPLDFVRGITDKLISTAVACRGGAQKLTPYLHMVEPRFWDNHKDLMKFAGVPQLPSKENLLHILGALRTKGALIDEDLDVATEVAQIWSMRYNASVVGLSLATTEGALVDISDLSYDDVPWTSVEGHITTHPKISRDLAARLKVRFLSDALRYGVLGISDLDDDEFYQREAVADGIRDTLERYTRESTFHEYVANADDCGSASEINFLVDGKTYQSKNLLTPELIAHQGPSLLIHNDGVFTDSDFDGLKHVGRGSKRDDPTTIGKFGRGSQTMYHWTDVPMILSGKSILILDPLRKCLPYNCRTEQRMPGIKLDYAKLKSICPDQIAPFEGLWGFDSNQSHYNGTIFRFPLRQDNEESELLESLRPPGISSVIEAFRSSLDVARSSLLFLRNITAITFSVNRDGLSDWSVRRGDWPDMTTYSDWANVVVEVNGHIARQTQTTERWWRAIVDVPEAPADLQHRHKRRMKHVECGMAAPVPFSTTTTSLQPLPMRFFNYLPLEFESTLPVQIHATFLLTGDRRNIATEETSQDAGSEWNRWLLETQLPSVYLQFLEDLGRKIGERVYHYFPVKVSDTPHVLSDLIRASFWNKIGSSTCRLFPVTPITDSRDSTTKSLRTAPELFTFAQSVFDVLDETDLNTLRLLLRRFRRDLVRPPLSLRQHVKDVPNVKTLTPSVVRRILKSATPEDIECVVKIEKDFLKGLLAFVMPRSQEEIIELHGCPILPLLAGRIGMLQLKQTCGKENKISTYFAAKLEPQKLFSFASSIFCAQSHFKFVELIADSGLLNVKRLRKNDAGVMLKFRNPSEMEYSSTTWLHRFWKYMNAEVESIEKDSLDLDTIQDFPLVLVRDRSQKEYVKRLTDFDKEPIVVQSTDSAHMDLFSDFAGLLIADPKTLPMSYQETEQSLLDPCAIQRFSKSIFGLAVTDGKSLTEYVRAKAKGKSIQTMQQLFIAHLSTNSLPLASFLNQFPLWPSVAADQGHLTATLAIKAANLAFVVPWIKCYRQFTSFDKPFKHALIDDATMLREYVLPALPEFLSEQTKSPYIKLIAAVSQSTTLRQNGRGFAFVVPLQDYRLAAGQDGVLRRARELFDHTDSIFSAAFRNQQGHRFLLRDIQGLFLLWGALGLRSRKDGYAAEDYLACLRAMEERLANSHDQHAVSDARIVVNPLCIHDGSLQFLDTSTWYAIAELQIFAVRQVSGSEPSHRRQRMEFLSSQNKTLCLRKIIQYDLASICWSQVPFAQQEPMTLSFQKSGHDGKPTCEIVWQHLAFLAEMALSVKESDIESFVEDLQKTYEHLNVNLQESKKTFTKRRTAKIWWNAEGLDPGNISSDSVKSSWTTLDNLLLDTPCDAKPMLAVQPFLGRFSTLLKGLGCQSIYYPEIKASSRDRSDPGLTYIRGLWQERVLTDVIFEAGGKEISAHKVVLASRSMYCKGQFAGGWAAHGNRKEPVHLDDMSHDTLHVLIDFCYGANTDWAARWRLKGDDGLKKIADNLDGLLDVLVAADRWLMPDLSADAESQILAGVKFFVRPDNVESVSDIADTANAKGLKAYCDEYAVCNAAAILLANADVD